MPFSDHSSDFSKEAIRQRMLQHMVELWGLASRNSIDPFPRMLLDTLASELHRVGQEFMQAESGLLERLAGLLTPPQLTGPRPAHAVVWARPAPAEPVAYILPTDSLLISRRVASRPYGEQDTNQNIFLSAVDTVKLLDGRVAWLASGTHLYRTNPDDGSKKLAGRGTALPARTLWLGLDVNPDLTSLDRLGLYLELPGKLQQLLSLMPLARWTLNGQPLTVHPGLCYDPEPVAAPLARETSLPLLGRAQADWQLEQDVKQAYQSRFLHVRQPESFALAAARTAPPPELASCFAGPAGEELAATQLVWLKAELPAVFDEQVVSELNVRLNAVPVLNRRLHRLLHRPRILPNLVPLPVEPREAFLSVRSLIDSRHNIFSPYPVPGSEQPAAGHYAVRRGGFERFDARDAHEQLSHLLEVLRDEAVAFAAYGQDTVQLEAQEFAQRLEKMKRMLSQQSRIVGEVPHYLLLNPHEGGGLLEVSYWTTAGEAANGLPADTELQPYDMTYLAGHKPVLLTATIGGANRRDPASQLDAYRSALLSHERLVTSEDIRTFVQAELGELLAEVKLQPGAVVSSQPRRGFVRTLNLLLVPTAGAGLKLSEAEWQEVTNSLHAKLLSRSVQDSQYHISIKLT